MKTSLLSLFLAFCLVGFSQSLPLRVGQKIPPKVWKTIPINKKARLVILDFWSTWCSNCIELFPKIEKLQKQFAEEMQIVLVNSSQNEQQVNFWINESNKRGKINGNELIELPEVTRIYGDTVLKKLFRPQTIPHLVWLSPAGQVKAITYGYNATANHVLQFLKGEKLTMALKDDDFKEKMLSKGLLQPTTSAIGDLSYSTLTGYVDGIGSIDWMSQDTTRKTVRFSLYNQSVKEYFINAFPIKRKTRILMAAKNKEQFERPGDNDRKDDWDRKFAFSYEIQMPIEEEVSWRDRLKQDVNYFFGNKFGIEGVVEKRKFKSLVLVKLKEDFLRSSSIEVSYKSNDSIFQVTNYLFLDLVNFLGNKLENMEAGRPFIDDTAIDPNLNVDMRLTGDLKNVENLRKQLQQYGLDIIEAEREVEVLVIREIKKDS